MSVPQPPSELEGHCSTIYDNTLYVLSPDSFLSLPLQEKAKWSKHAMGEPVTGPACVLAGDGADAAFYVIGGQTSNGSYPGMQKYSFAQGTWETIQPQVDVLSGRVDHSVAYLADTQQILVYAGSQPKAYSFLSSQTFLISTQSPYDILAFTSAAPPGNLPIVQTFNTSHAVMLGGSNLNTAIFTFGPSDGWQQLSAGIASPIDPSSRATVIDGADGSKVLNLYNMNVSPNTVSPIVLLGPGGVPSYTGEPVGSGTSTRKRKRDLTLSSWPTYRGKNAPSATRSDCNVVQGDNGLAVISGGSTEAPVALFNEDRNSWVDASKFFDSRQHQKPLKPSHTSSSTSKLTQTPTPTPTKSSTPSASTTAAAGGSGTSGHDRMLRTLGIILGVLCGIAALFIIILLLLRWRKIKKRKQEGYLDEKNDGGRMSFADRGASFMKEAGGSINGLAPPSNKGWNNSQNGSRSSLAIITGRFGNKRNTNGHEPKPSYDSTTPIFRNKNRDLGDEPVEMVSLDEKRMSIKRIPRTELLPPAAPYGPTLTAADARRGSTDSERRNRSSGWSKYFATSQPTGPNGISHLPSAYAQTNKMSDASVYSTHDRNDRNASKASQLPSSTLVPPLDIDFSRTVDGQRLSHVTTSSPAFNDSREDLAFRGGGTTNAPEAQRGIIVDPRRSATDTISSYNRSTMSTTTSEFYHDSTHTPWTPTSTAATFKDHLVSRPPSSVYPPSEPRVPSRGKGVGGGGFFPGNGLSYRPAASKTAKVTSPPASDWPSAATQESGLKVLRPTPKEADDRDSSITVFPAGVPSAYYAGREREEGGAKPVNSDLGWLNLGLAGNGPNPVRI